MMRAGSSRSLDMLLDRDGSGIDDDISDCDDDDYIMMSFCCKSSFFVFCRLKYELFGCD